MTTVSIQYPGDDPGKSSATVHNDSLVLENAALRAAWKLEQGSIGGLCLENRHTGQTVTLEKGCMPLIVLGEGRTIDLGNLKPESSPAAKDTEISAEFIDKASGQSLKWSVALSDGSNAIIQSLSLCSDADTVIQEAVLIDSDVPGASQAGEVDGSVVVCGDTFMAAEHPLAKNHVDGEHVRCTLQLGSELAAGESRTYTSVFGIAPSGQLRRAFLYYIERRRIRPYKQFLHYNNWYDVVLSRPSERMTEEEALYAIEYYGRELVEKRGVKVDAVVWDDGWDDFNTLWGFHKGFPEGFRNLMRAGEKYGIAQGVWMSPNGGYAHAKDARIAYGKPLGYETNENGFAMGGEKYRSAFHAMCLEMMRDNGVVFFKFDGMGEGGNTSGASGMLSNDVNAILELSRQLHEENPDLHVSATAGTWASPFWLLFADNVWRQGCDTGHYGEGDTRQTWITYRDMFCCERVVGVGPLYPLNSLMLHGIVIGDRPGRAPSGMEMDEKSVADEIWSFFASGTCLQELYVSPDGPTDCMLDDLADAAKWARANEAILVDTHWVGGNPGKGEVYGWASWQPGKGIIALRNPSQEGKAFSFSLKGLLELPADVDVDMRLRPVYPRQREVPAGKLATEAALEVFLQPFETVVMEAE